MQEVKHVLAGESTRKPQLIRGYAHVLLHLAADLYEHHTATAAGLPRPPLELVYRFKQLGEYRVCPPAPRGGLRGFALRHGQAPERNREGRHQPNGQRVDCRNGAPGSQGSAQANRLLRQSDCRFAALQRRLGLWASSSGGKPA
ncbi:MAG: hypothetical protein WKG07_31720 [Hymenobacter sp.]